jgi:hypothetical protein
MDSILNRLVKAVRSAAVYNPEVQVAPTCILWPDRDRQWEAIIPRLQGEMPELFILGNYSPDKRTGPAIWLRCVIAGRTNNIVPDGCTPILYLPAVSRQDLRVVASCPEQLKPLVELQYRGVIWAQINAKDWTILAFLKSDQGGLGLDVAQDNDTKNAMQLALYCLLDEEMELLKGRRLDRDYFNTLLTGGDPIRDLLQWLDQGDAFQNSRSDNEWKAFVEVCESKLAFNPQNKGALAGAAKLAAHDEGPWHAVWERYCEAPKRYQNIPAQIRKCKPPNDTMFWHMGNGSYEGWPQWNEDQERNLHRDLIALDNMPPHEARIKLLELEKHHGHRRKLVWAELDEAPLAQTMDFLSLLAETTKNGLAAGTVEDLAAGYCNQGWKADDAVLGALSLVEKMEGFDAVKTAIRAVYLPWAEESARHLQKCWNPQLPLKSKYVNEAESCILFVDGLRFDCGKRLADMLENEGCQVAEKPVWAALPSVTGTGKPAVAPMSGSKKIAEDPAPFNFEPLSSYQLKKAIEDSNWTVPDKNSSPYPCPPDVQKLWVEFGDIDHEGHDRGWKLARQIDILLKEIQDQIISLLAAGWKSVRVVTDHGWLLLPGGLPKIELPSALADSKWGRCASLKPGASTEERLYPWFWNPNQYFALADGISCFRKGEDYAHGGLSLQECLTLELTITKENTASAVTSVEFTDIVWKGLRCTVAIDEQFSGLSLDIRTQPGNSSSSVVVSTKPLKDNGTASVVVEDAEITGKEAYIVLLDTNDGLVAQRATVIGGGGK